MARAGGMVGNFKVVTTHNRGFSPEELAEQCTEKIIKVGDRCHPLIKDQAIAFRDNVESTVLGFIKQAAREERLTLVNTLIKEGHPEIAEIIRRL